MTSVVQYTTNLIPWASEVHYQGNEGTCGPNEIANSVNLITNLYNQPFEVNRQALYNMYLNDYHLLGTDAGVVPTLFADMLNTQGVTQNTDVQYGIEHINELPSPASYTDAATHTLQMTRIPTEGMGENQMAHFYAQKLLEGKPLFLAFNVMHDFADQTGPLSQQPGGNLSPLMGGHAVEVVGVETATNMLDVASWGSQYGDHGYFHLSLDNFFSTAGGAEINLRSMWEIDGFNGVDLKYTPQTEQVAEAFVGLLDRAPAQAGMHYYAGLNQSLGVICDSVIATSEGQAQMGSLNDTDYVQHLFHNILGRDALTGGLNFYTGELANGATRGQVAAEIMTAGMDRADWQDGMFFGDGSLLGHPKNPDANIYNESLLFQNKVIAAQDYAIALQAPGGHNDVATSLIDHVTTDPGSIWGVALVGVREQLGYAHIDGAVVS